MSLRSAPTTLRTPPAHPWHVPGSWQTTANRSGYSRRPTGLAHAFEYSDDDDWPQAADGDGRSLIPVITDPEKQALGLNHPKNWTVSAANGGSPGADDGPAVLPKDSDGDGIPDAWEQHGLNHLLDDAAMTPTAMAQPAPASFTPARCRRMPIVSSRLRIRAAKRVRSRSSSLCAPGARTCCNPPTRRPARGAPCATCSPRRAGNGGKRIPIGPAEHLAKRFYRLRVLRLAD